MADPTLVTIGYTDGDTERSVGAYFSEEGIQALLECFEQNHVEVQS